MLIHRRFSLSPFDVIKYILAQTLAFDTKDLIITNCSNLIVVMNKRHVVEMDNHKESLAKQGVYKKLYQTQ